LGDISKKLFYLHRDALTSGSKSPLKSFEPWLKEQHAAILALEKVAANFRHSMLSYMQEAEYLDIMNERITKASGYFIPKIKAIEDSFNAKLSAIGFDKVPKQFLKSLEASKELLKNKVIQINKNQLFVAAAYNGQVLDKHTLNQSSIYAKHTVGKPKKSDKTPTAEISFKFFKEGKTVAEIAKEREFTEGTILNHLTRYVSTGDIEAGNLMDHKKLSQIVIVIESIGGGTLTEIKSKLGDEFTYDDVKIALAHYKFINEK